MNKTQPEVISLYEFLQKFPDEESARIYFEEKRWPNGKSCPSCGGLDIYECVNHNPMPYRCKDCRKHFSVRTNSTLEKSRIPLHKWLMAIYMMTIARKGIPSTQMARELGITQKSAWFLAQRIREAWALHFSDTDHTPTLRNTVEVDETFIGGKEKNKHTSKKLKQGRGRVGKAIVAGAVERDGLVKATVITDTTSATLKNFIHTNVTLGSTVYTDEFRSYRGLDGYVHLTVNHSAGEYVKDQAHTNGIESFWALLKRGYYGIYHYMSFKHLHRYVNEFSFRHNTSSFGTLEFIEMTVKKMAKRRLTYKELINV